VDTLDGNSHRRPDAEYGHNFTVLGNRSAVADSNFRRVYGNDVVRDRLLGGNSYLRSRKYDGRMDGRVDDGDDDGRYGGDGDGRKRSYRDDADYW